ncbi:hypothetical protein WKH56_19940 [Priestia sp. SB1]|uniref:hypothetical protein n=1 Tax=Priestia sp. SB1 TaxID=3132359 RepID=UPI00317F8093
MSKQYKIKSLEGINWDDHNDCSNPDYKIIFNDLLGSRAIEVGDVVEVSYEYIESLEKTVYYVTFNKPNVIYLEEGFFLDECKVLFGEDFNYGVSE